MHEIETNERRLTLLKELGRGAFARVSLASFNGAKVAVKSVALSDETAAAMASNEIDVLDWLARRGVVGVVKLRGGFPRSSVGDGPPVVSSNCEY